MVIYKARLYASDKEELTMKLKHDLEPMRIRRRLKP